MNKILLLLLSAVKLQKYLRRPSARVPCPALRRTLDRPVSPPGPPRGVVADYVTTLTRRRRYSL